MTRLLKMVAAPMVLGSALFAVAPSSAQAQGFGIQLYGGNYGYPYGTYYNSYNSFYASPYSAGYPNMYQYQFPSFGYPYNTYYGGGYNYRSYHHHHHCR